MQGVKLPKEKARRQTVDVFSLENLHARETPVEQAGSRNIFIYLPFGCIFKSSRRVQVIENNCIVDVSWLQELPKILKEN